MMRKMIIELMRQHFSSIEGKTLCMFSVSTRCFALYLTKGPILSNFLVKVSDSPITAMLLVFLVRAQYIEKEGCLKLVKLS